MRLPLWLRALEKKNRIGPSLHDVRGMTPMRLAQDGRGSGGGPTAFLLSTIPGRVPRLVFPNPEIQPSAATCDPGEIVKKPLYKKSPSAATAKAKNSELKLCNIGSRKHAVHIAHSSPA